MVRRDTTAFLFRREIESLIIAIWKDGEQEEQWHSDIFHQNGAEMIH